MPLVTPRKDVIIQLTVRGGLCLITVLFYILGFNSSCIHCLPPGQTKPNSTQFLNNLYHFFTANPTTSCAAAGHAAYNSAVKINYTLNVIEGK